MKYTLTFEINGFLKNLFKTLSVLLPISGLFVALYFGFYMFSDNSELINILDKLADISVRIVGLICMAVIFFSSRTSLV